MTTQVELAVLVATMGDVLGTTVGPDADFFAAGGDSLDAAELFAKLHQLYGTRWPESLLVRHPTAAELQPHLVPGSEGALIRVQEGGAKPPLLAVYGASGYVFGVQRLARHLGPDQPVLGLEPFDAIAAKGKRTTSIDSAIVDTLRAVTEATQWEVMGVGGAGIAALQAVQHLEHAGRRVPVLTLLGSKPWPASVTGDTVRANLLVLDVGGSAAHVEEWQALTSGSVRRQEIPSRPGRLLHEPGVRAVARELARERIRSRL